MMTILIVPKKKMNIRSLTGTILLLTALSLVAFPALAGSELDSRTAAAGLKEALQVGTGRAVDMLGQVDGYLKNPKVHIPVPEKLESVEKGLRAIGMDNVIDEFETSMNRAAEAAAPLAKEVFVDSIKEMTFEDALTIVRGKKHEATDYLRKNAGPTLAERFHPIVETQLDEVGATKAFNSLMDRTASLPLIGKPAFELDDYVTEKALDGLFLMIAKEEKKIREDPVARTTDLLKTVFGGGEEEDKTPWYKRLFGRDK